MACVAKDGRRHGEKGKKGGNGEESVRVMSADSMLMLMQGLSSAEDTHPFPPRGRQQMKAAPRRRPRAAYQFFSCLTSSAEDWSHPVARRGRPGRQYGFHSSSRAPGRS